MTKPVVNIAILKYEIAKEITKKMLKAGLITQEEYDRIDVKNKEIFAA